MNDHQDLNVDARQFWNSLYQEKERVWSGRVNAGLIDIAAELTPGRALDVGCGEGGDALWLANRGWQVTGVDISNTALNRARIRAEQEGFSSQQVRWLERDLVSWEPPGQYDLVSAFFLQSQIDFPREQVLHSLCAAVAPEGLFVLVSHAAPPPWARESHREHGRFPTPEQELEALNLDQGKWTVLVNEVRERAATGPDGQTGVLQDTVVIVQRIV